PTPPPTPVATRITITPSSATLNAIGQTVQLTARVFDQNSAVMAGAAVTWTSADPRIVSVSSGGLATAVMYGIIRITARSGGASQDIEIKVVQTAGRITIEPTEVAFTAIGETVQLNATVQDRNGQTIEGANVTWRSSDTEVARVSTTGLVTSTGNGTTRITARSGSTEQSVTVRVMQTPTGIAIEPSEVNLTAIGETIQLIAKVVDPNNRTIEGAAVTWQSSDASAATVSADGLVTAVNNGTATITATSGDLSASSDVTVMQTPVGIVIDPEESILAAAGDTVQLMATVLDHNGHAIDGADVTWESGDESIATVDGQGLVTAVAGGTVEITARSGEESSTSSITVKDVVLDREVLSILYQATNGDEWTNNENWLSNGPLSDWYGVIASASGEVVRLELPRNNLQGPLPAELCHLASLGVLDLRYNDLTGNLPPEFGLLANLRWLGLAGNGITGGIPPELGQLSLLTSLSLDSTELTGNIPPELGLLTNLSWLSILNSRLTGNIPPELGQLSDLTILYLAGNELTGSIPPELGQLASLEQLSLTANKLTGTIPPELGQLVDLTDLHIGSNMLTGDIPSELAQLTKLTSLSIAKNRLTGHIPPELGQLTELTFLGFNHNELTGNIPPELGKLTKLELLYFDRNELTGNIPPELGQLINLRELWFKDNRLAGSIPPELGQLENLSSLTFDDNRLTGAIPPELGQLTELGTLWLNDNPGLSGPLPTAFTGLEKMTYLKLENTSLCVPPTSAFQTWIDGIQNVSGVQQCSGL
ncbi:MAG: hypothetical protein F4Z03_04250, partial [Gemmatimonadetes bacterium]|nr:hypothetical protein [Gemmatimonadota bacterium]